MEKQTKQWLVRGSLLGFIAGSIFVASNKQARTKVITLANTTKTRTQHWIQVINDNRDSVMQQLQASKDNIMTIVDEASEDVEALMETSKNLKSHALNLVSSVQDSKEELLQLTAKLQAEKDMLEPSQELLPAPDEEDDQKKLEEL
ncbi:hypothetical protein HXA31_02145 [Salipaludibacillus agaradhaerens]|uniref:YtxH domain-containing protein n=1 Tax=Salipaludibacillus agaradhaerens TaxID=76935 RepID=A0A9Q4B2W6_SALAG|nr:hypothetical protein [Salipaludibacillus agaradhaerens]MCR6097349.1 hypothetical protein [Salipaludibacillus agaradhaerens]MCR6113166.1 hypothetical protein [Salipaludibacillus agaradhaerens]